MTQVVTIPLKTLKRIEEALGKLDETWISELEACELLGISRKTLQNKLIDSKDRPKVFYDGIHYKKTIVGTRMWNKAKLLND
jgi:hypothetical protein